MVGDWTPAASVHLQSFPETIDVDQEILDEMARVREVINNGLALRMRKSETESQVKVRQPLARLVYGGERLPEWGEEIVRDEVNVKEVAAADGSASVDGLVEGDGVWLDKELTEELREEGFVRELIRAVQSARKKAGLMVDDRIRLSVSCEVPAAWVEMLKTEVLAEELSVGNGATGGSDAAEGMRNYAYDEIAKVNGENVTLSLEKM